MVALMVGLPLGLLIRALLPQFQYNTVVPLGVATWIAALLSVRTAKIGKPKSRVPVDPSAGRLYHAYLELGEDKYWSENELANFYANMSGPTLAPTDSTGANSLLGMEVRAILMSCSEQLLSPPAAQAFPESSRLVGEISKKWNDGTIKLHLVQMQQYLPRDAKFKALSCFSPEEGLHILVNMADQGNSKGRPFANNNYQFIAEILLHAGAEFLLQMPHHSGLLAESLPAFQTTRAHEKYKVSESIRREIAHDETAEKRSEAIAIARRQLLYYSCFGVDCELGWDNLPGEIRSILFRRCLGERYDLTEADSAWLEKNLLKDLKTDLQTHIGLCDFGMMVAVNQLRFFKSIKPDESLSVLAKLSRLEMRSPEGSYLQMNDAPIPFLKRVARSFIGIYHGFGIWLKFFIVSLTADPEFHRELKFTLETKPRPLAAVITYVLSVIWINTKIAQHLVLPWFLVSRQL